MSLVDALLLDPYPFEIWIAQRSSKGTGTLNDPYGVTTAADFDTLMNSLPANSRIHLGPGEFKTTGYTDAASTGWQVKAGMKISGAGMDVTKLKIELPGGYANGHYYAVGHALITGGPAQPNLMDYFELSDLTIDCNLAGQAQFQFACGAVRIMGNHSRIRRVKAINWGAKSGVFRCFVISVIIADPPSGVTEIIDAGIEDCIVVEPAASPTPNTGPATLIHAGGLESGTGTHEEAFGKGPFIRNCYLDAGSPSAAAEFRGISMSWCRGGVVEGNQVHNIKFGGPYQDLTSTRDIVIRNNLYKNVYKGPSLYLRTYGPSVGTATLSKSGLLITATTTPNHKLFTGDRVAMDATPNEFDQWALITVTAVNQFTYFSSVSGSPTSASGIQKLFGVDWLVIEGNTIELATATAGELIGIHVEDVNGTSADPTYPAYQHGQVIIRNNKIRYVDGAYQTSPPLAGYGIQVNGAKAALIQHNVIECVPANPIRNARCGAATYFNNRTPSGVLIQGLNETTSQKYGELETDAEDALVLVESRK